MGYQYEMFSINSGETWGMSVPSRFSSPQSPMSIKKIPDKEYLLSIWNPIPNYLTRDFTRHSGGRTPLVGAISKDNARTWGEAFALETSEESGFCYTAIH